MNSNYNNSGKLHLILGCMYSGKTSELISRYKSYTIGGKKCIMIKYKKDNRYDSTHVITHDGVKIQALVCEYLSTIDKNIQEYDVICIDEIQFYKDAAIFCDKWSTIDRKIVEVCGLNGTFQRKQFKIISKLVPMAENICWKTAVCKETGKKAVYSKRLTDQTEEELIGGENMYSAVDRITYFKNNLIETQCGLFFKFIKNKLKENSDYKNNKNLNRENLFESSKNIITKKIMNNENIIYEQIWIEINNKN